MDALVDADVVITASGIGYSLIAEHVAAMKDGAIVAVGGAGPPEFDPTMLGTLTEPLIWGDTVRDNIQELRVPGGNTVFVIADGYCANTSAGEGNPIEVMDLSLALQMRAIDYLAANDLPVGVHLLPKEVDDQVASSQLAAAGLAIDTPSTAQIEAARTW